jgi:hypothetical protein
MPDSNMPNQRLISFTIADLAIMASALSLASATAMMYGGSGKQAQKRLKQLQAEFDKMCPISKTHRDKEYAWFDAFSAVVDAKGYHLHLETNARYGWRTDSARLMMVVDDRVYALTDDLDMRDTDGVIPDKYQQMLTDTLVLAQEAASMDAEYMQDTVIRVSVVFEKDNYLKRQEQEKLAAHKAILRELNSAGVDELDFHVRNLDYADVEGRENMYDVTVLVRPSDEARLQAVFEASPEAALKL